MKCSSLAEAVTLLTSLSGCKVFVVKKHPKTRDNSSNFLLFNPNPLILFMCVHVIVMVDLQGASNEPVARKPLVLSMPQGNYLCFFYHDYFPPQ